MTERYDVCLRCEAFSVARSKDGLCGICHSYDSEVVRVIRNTAEDLLQAMQRVDTTQREVAAKLGKAESFVSRALRGDQNLTLRTIAQLAFAAGFRFKPHFEETHNLDAGREE